MATKKAIFTKQQLIDARACQEQVDLFERTFGQEVNVTVKRAIKVASLFDWDFAKRFLSPTAWAGYDRAKATARAEYDRALATARAEYNRAMATAWAGYDRAKATAWAEYNRAMAPAWAEGYIATCNERG
jgi:cell division septum initiation protein DivIVA